MEIGEEVVVKKFERGKGPLVHFGQGRCARVASMDLRSARIARSGHGKDVYNVLVCFEDGSSNYVYHTLLDLTPKEMGTVRAAAGEPMEEWRRYRKPVKSYRDRLETTGPVALVGQPA